MRPRATRSIAFAILIAAGAALPGFGQQKSGVPYRIEFNSGHDVTTHDKDVKTGKEGLYIKVRFAITLEGGAAKVQVVNPVFIK